MTVLVIILVLAAALFIAMKTGKVRDADGNNIPDVLEEKVAEVKEVVEKVKKATSKKPEVKQPAKKVKKK
jgi:hypothetical protein